MHFLYHTLLFASLFTTSCLSNVEAALQSEKIIGGNIANKGSFKYVVSIQFNNHHFCGGGIIDNRHILTAAHCLINETNQFREDEFTVVVGSISAHDNVIPALRIPVEKAYVLKEFEHLPFTPKNPLSREVADIAVLKLKNRLDLNGNPLLSKLILPQEVQYYPTYVNKNPVIAGFGFEGVTYIRNKKNKQDVPFPTIANYRLKFAETTVIHNDICAIKYKHAIRPSHLCAQMKQRNPKSAEGICNGDSGSPLVLNNDVVIGIAVSSPSWCTESEKPAVYTRVTSYLSFIKKAMRGERSQEIRSMPYS